MWFKKRRRDESPERMEVEGQGERDDFEMYWNLVNQSNGVKIEMRLENKHTIPRDHTSQRTQLLIPK